MTIEEMQRRKKEFGYSNEKLAELSGVPLGTVQKVMSGSTKSPRQGTLEALARALNGQKEVPTRYPGEMIDGCIRVLREPWGAYAAKKEEYTIEDIYALPEGVRAELIDGEIYYMATPTRTHQKIVGEMYLAVAGFVRSHGGACEVYIPPYAVYLNADNSIYLEPDLTVICDPARMDYLLKLFKYRTAGVREYWIINPEKRIVSVYSWIEGHESADMYSFGDEIPSGIYPDLKIRLADVV